MDGNNLPTVAFGYEQSSSPCLNNCHSCNLCRGQDWVIKSCILMDVNIPLALMSEAV